jgi:DNA polymerase III subunit alpha
VLFLLTPLPYAFASVTIDSMSRPFVHLHTHTHYSLLDATTKVPELVATAQAQGCPAVAITDHGVMYGAVELYNAAKAAGIQPVVGADMYLIDGDPADRSTRQPNYELVLLTQSHKGYQNLVKQVSDAQLHGFYYKPRLNWQQLEANADDLVALSGGLSGPIAHAILRNNLPEAQARAERLKALYPDRFYIELQDHGHEAQRKVMHSLVDLAQHLHIPMVMTNDTHFTQPADTQLHNIMLCLQNGQSINDPGRFQPYGPEYYLKTGDQLAQSFPELDRALVNTALDNTLHIASQCAWSWPMGQSILPDFPLPPGDTMEAYLHAVVDQHAIQRYGGISQAVRDRLDFELNIINQMGFPAYFLIVWDFIHYAKQQNIPVGPGRGSAAGSLVAYVLGITNIDPLKHNLLFERFLNPERVSMPDIDIDFCIDRREQVIDYVTQRYGQDRVCQIVTFGTFAARAAVKAIARVMDIPFADSDKLAKLIPATPGTKLKDAMTDVTDLAKLYETDARTKEWIDLALKLEGTINNVGIHAAGVVISKDPLTQVVPLQHSKEGQVISQYPMGDLEKLGLLKMDFLGLRNLTIIDHTINLINTHEHVQLDMDTLALNDTPVYEMLTQAQTDGVFQLESGGMKALVRDLKPSTFEDINALVALFRPGPLNSGMVKSFVDRKHGREAVVFQHPSLQPILQDTYGTIVYQEQIMQIAQVLAGYSLGQADLLRRAMGKKKAEVMAKEKDGFVAGATANGVDADLANSLFDTMSEFAAYCFNRSHSAAYALVAYQTAYLKAHHPVAYLSALLSSVSNDMDKLRHYLVTARQMSIAVLPPDVNTSGAAFTPDGPNIRFGLASLKNVGLAVVEALVAERTAHGLFASLDDFLLRVDSRTLNRKTLESLIFTGALSTFGYTRRQLMLNLDGLIRFATKGQSQQETGQVSLFSVAPDVAVQTLVLTGDPTEYPDEEIQQLEKQFLGFFVSSHPLDAVRQQLPVLVTATATELHEHSDGSILVLGGLITSAQRKITKTNRPLCIGKLEDLTGELEFVAFSDAIETYDALLQEGQRVLIHAKLQLRGEDQRSLVVQQVTSLQAIQPMVIGFKHPPSFECLSYLGNLLATNTGAVPVVLAFPDGSRYKLGPRFWTGLTPTAIYQALAHAVPTPDGVLVTAMAA